MKNFSELGVAPQFIKALTDKKILVPTEIQEKSIPYLLSIGSDFIGQAPTGTGKTAAFGLPLLNFVNHKVPKIQALILCPTRELGQQIAKQLFHYTKYSEKIFVEAVYGGENIELQTSRLRRTTHILVATPGRLLELVDKGIVSLEDVAKVVLDEADEMLSLGFKKDLDNILKLTSKNNAKTWLFSATMPDDIKAIIKKYLSPKAMKVEVIHKTRSNKDITHQYLVCTEQEKFPFLLHFLNGQGANRGVIFCKTKEATKQLTEQLKAKKISADAIHGDLLQIERNKVMRAFKGEKLKILVATDLAARGIDVAGLAYVVHYQIPDKAEYYIHRSGRTGRAGMKGLSIAFITEGEMKSFKFIEKALGLSIDRVKVK